MIVNSEAATGGDGSATCGLVGQPRTVFVQNEGQVEEPARSAHDDAKSDSRWPAKESDDQQATDPSDHHILNLYRDPRRGQRSSRTWKEPIKPHSFETLEILVKGLTPDPKPSALSRNIHPLTVSNPRNQSRKLWTHRNSISGHHSGQEATIRMTSRGSGCGFAPCRRVSG